MPVDLTPGGRFTAARVALQTISVERDALVGEVHEITADFEIICAEAEDRRLENLELVRELEELRALARTDRTMAYEDALNRIVAANGRGALKIAREALQEE